MKSLLLHLAIAFTWLFLSPQRDLPQLIKGLAIGYGILLLFQPLLPDDRYLKGSKAFILWIIAFGKARALERLRAYALELLIHALEADDPAAIVEDIRENLLKPLLGFTRP